MGAKGRSKDLGSGNPILPRADHEASFGLYRGTFSHQALTERGATLSPVPLGAFKDKLRRRIASLPQRSVFCVVGVEFLQHPCPVDAKSTPTVTVVSRHGPGIRCQLFRAFEGFLHHSTLHLPFLSFESVIPSDARYSLFGSAVQYNRPGQTIEGT